MGDQTVYVCPSNLIDATHRSRGFGNEEEGHSSHWSVAEIDFVSLRGGDAGFGGFYHLRYTANAAVY